MMMKTSTIGLAEVRSPSIVTDGLPYGSPSYAPTAAFHSLPLQAYFNQLDTDMIILNQQTEQQLYKIARQTNQNIQQLIERFIDDYQQEQQSIKLADSSYAEYLKTGESFSLEQIKQQNDLAN
jgi:hypothetical protein